MMDDSKLEYKSGGGVVTRRNSSSEAEPAGPGEGMMEREPQKEQVSTRPRLCAAKPSHRGFPWML